MYRGEKVWLLCNNNIRIIWIDFLCWGSAVKLLNILSKHSVEKIYYINLAKSFSPFLTILQKLTRKPFVNVDWVVESEETINSVSLYECIHRKLSDVLDKWVHVDHREKRNKLFCEKHKYNIDKYNAHLKEAACAYLFRPIEITVLDERLTGAMGSLFLLRKTPFSKVLKEICGKEKTYFYSTIISHRLAIENRSDYHFDDHSFSRKYFSDRIVSILWFFVPWLLDSLNGIFFALVRNFLYRKSFNTQQNIGMELTQSRVRLDEIGDLFWLEDSGIQPETVCSIEFEDYDAKSIDVIKKVGIKRFKYYRNSLKRIWRSMKNLSSVIPGYVTFSAGTYCFNTFPSVIKLWFPFLCWNETGWLRLQEVFYTCRTMFWVSIYRQLGLKILWTMYDRGEDKLTKAQAMEKVNGLFVGSHWSNFPMYKVDNQKCIDVLFTWGEHFTNNNFNRYPFMEIFQVGYPSDHYFEKRRSKAVRLRNRYPGKFVLSYQDNVMANDLPYSKNMQIQIHEMLLSILKEYDDVVVFIKPKREYVFNAVIKEVPELREYIDKGRIVTFFGETNRTKAVPAEIGMASDLVVGLGISTTAAECQFAGTLGFHADLTGFRNNEFGNKGLGKIVFRDVDSLKNAIIDVIENGASKKYLEYKELYSTLDPFQDGNAYRRIGFVMKNLQDSLNRGLSREDTVSIAREKYDKFIIETYKEQILC
jgi:hypothetical protein